MTVEHFPAVAERAADFYLLRFADDRCNLQRGWERAAHLNVGRESPTAVVSLHIARSWEEDSTVVPLSASPHLFAAFAILFSARNKGPSTLLLQNARCAGKLRSDFPHDAGRFLPPPRAKLIT